MLMENEMKKNLHLWIYINDEIRNDKSKWMENILKYIV